MKTEIRKSKGTGVLDDLTEQEKEYLFDVGTHGRIVDVLEALKKRNIEVSPSTVCRFLQRQRERRMLEEGEAMKETVQTLAERGNEGKLKRATLEAVRQRLFEQALSMGNDAEGITKVFDALLKEELRLKELELESRRTAVAEENLRLQRQRVQIAAFKTAVRYIPEVLRILADETLEDKVKVVEARRCLAQADRAGGEQPAGERDELNGSAKSSGH